MPMYKDPTSSSELIYRTKEIISQYKERECYLGEKFYDVTLLLLAFTAILIHIREENIKNNEDEDLTEILRSTVTSAQDKNKNIIQIKFNEYIIALRNGLAHGNTKFYSDKDGNINKLEVTGTTKQRNKLEKHTIVFSFDITHDKNKLEEIIDLLISKFYTN